MERCWGTCHRWQDISSIASCRERVWNGTWMASERDGSVTCWEWGKWNGFWVGIWIDWFFLWKPSDRFSITPKNSFFVFSYVMIEMADITQKTVCFFRTEVFTKLLGVLVRQLRIANLSLTCMLENGWGWQRSKKVGGWSGKYGLYWPNDIYYIVIDVLARFFNRHFRWGHMKNYKFLEESLLQFLVFFLNMAMRNALYCTIREDVFPTTSPLGIFQSFFLTRDSMVSGTFEQTTREPKKWTS